MARIHDAMRLLRGVLGSLHVQDFRNTGLLRLRPRLSRPVQRHVEPLELRRLLSGTVLYHEAVRRGPEAWEDQAAALAEGNHAPTGFEMLGGEVREGVPATMPVAGFLGEDPDGDPLTYTLVSGPGSEDNAAFGIRAEALITRVVFKYQVKRRYNIRVRATDPGGLFIEKALVVNVLPSVTITGTVFNDVDGDGVRDKGEGILRGIRAWIDLDRDGTVDTNEPQRQTDPKGRYSFRYLEPGRYLVRLQPGSGWRVSVPPSGHNLAAAGSAVFAKKDFGVTQRALVSGTVFNDANGNCVRNKGEAGLAKWVVFLDKDRDAVLDAGETRVPTRADGSFAISAPAGAFVLRLQRQGGYRSTTPAGGRYSGTFAAGQVLKNRHFGVRR